MYIVTITLATQSNLTIYTAHIMYNILNNRLESKIKETINKL